MQIGPFIVTYTVIWWLVFFILLPLGIEMENNPQTGNAESAPKNPRLVLKIIIATITAGILSVISINLIDRLLSSEAFKKFLEY
ncbi:MAG: DUF1467 family protein [Alphaproteobacteria bacterium]